MGTIIEIKQKLDWLLSSQAQISMAIAAAANELLEQVVVNEFRRKDYSEVRKFRFSSSARAKSSVESIYATIPEKVTRNDSSNTIVDSESDGEVFYVNPKRASRNESQESHHIYDDVADNIYESLDKMETQGFCKNGLLSYENPNYQMDRLRMERNSHLYEEIISELQQQGTLRPAGNVNLVGGNRKGYLDITASMGVDGPGVGGKEAEGNSLKEKQKLLDGSPNESETQKDQNSEKGDNRATQQQQEEDIKHIAGTLNADDLYALPNKKKQEVDEVPPEEDDDDGQEDEKGKQDEQEDIEGIEDKDKTKDLPPGWEKHEDNSGPYYWHIKSGTIQREPPVWPKEELPTKEPTGAPKTPNAAVPTARYVQNSMFSQTLANLYGTPKPELESSSSPSSSGRMHESMTSSVTRSSTSSALDQEDDRRRREEMALKRRSFPLKSDTDRPIRFAVRSLGWVEIAEEDLTPERSSKAVNKCIVDLSLGRNEMLDVVGRWGDGKDLFMDLDEGALKLIDPESLTILNSQPIHTIRVWGVGRDNGRDFAYVARDRLTRIHMCHVFRCDTAARTIANTLRDICKRIMIERSLQLDANSSSSSSSRCAIRPTDLPTENRRWIRHPASFPTPMEEPKKVLRAQYIGQTEVHQATGMDVLNDAIAKVISETQVENWDSVNVSVAPSMISINTSDAENRLLCECRVRYLCFLGIGKNIKNCAFIMHTAQDRFVAHVFHCEPSSGALCKTIEAACKLRYQKCLDAHPEASGRYSADSHTPGKGIGATLKNLMSSFSLKKDKASS
ncbi:protein Fe65 homolog isoform X2 [Uranotaenia lowii]|uniref:protein Fe65 homolog isoform X2 n=1 Tax=Uranotaenia lowii TaxID=190385 RepID=UPI00247AD228|nr:protein Fe65 homolog isoform X2 [Uranotaenia lowii]